MSFCRRNGPVSWRVRPVCGRSLFAPGLFVTLVAVLALMCGASSAFASGRPNIYIRYVAKEEVFASSTRMIFEANLQSNELDTKWRAEYSTSKSALENGAGIVASSGTRSAAGVNQEGSEDPSIGFGVLDTQLNPGAYELHHLAPGTHYYAQFVAENSAGKTVVPFEFTTLPIARPGVGLVGEDQLTTFRVHATSPTTAAFNAELETNGAATTYSFGYSTSPSGPVTICASGSVSVAEDYAELVQVPCTGLAPETTYYVHLVATNEKGTFEQTTFSAIGANVDEVSTFTTPTAKPIVFTPAFRNVTAVSAHVTDGFLPHGEETRWRFESAASVIGPWTAVPGGAGTVSQAEAESFPEGGGPVVGATLTGLSAAKTYYVRLFAENAAGEAENGDGEPVSSESRALGSFETTAPPTASTLIAHTLHGEALRIIGMVDPNNELTSEEQTVTLAGAPSGGTFTLTFDGQITAPIAYNAPAEGPGSVEKALEALSTIGGLDRVTVTGSVGGPYTVYFGTAESPLTEKAEPELEADGSGLTPSGTVTVAVVQQGGVAYDVHSHFEYVSEEQFKDEGEWAKAASTPEVDDGFGTATEFMAADLPELKDGETYRYRLVATSDAPGDPVVDGSQQALIVPTPPASESSVSCSNGALRTGASANLPDCRGYEQLTPLDKGGAREPYTYALALAAGFGVSEDGEHALLEAETDWGSGPSVGQGPYFFSHQGDGVWRMTAAAIEPETGIDHFAAELFSANLTEVAFSSSFTTGHERTSQDSEFRAGAVGGPYKTIASVPTGGAGAGWVGASRDFSRLFLSSAETDLLGSSTGTKRGYADLYEYSGEEFHQVNVISGSPGSTIGSCGAKIVRGNERSGLDSSVHAVSTDGSRVFFEAVPGSDCAEPTHLYMRVDGETTVDIGAYTFFAANAEGTEVLLQKVNGGTSEILLYDTASANLKPLFTVDEVIAHNAERIEVSEDLSTIVFLSGGNLYDYDMSAGKLTFVDSTDHGVLKGLSPDGRDLYFEAVSVGGVPGGVNDASQTYRYDSDEAVIQCVSCASPFDSEPKLLSVYAQSGGKGGVLESKTGLPRTSSASANGDYVFFDTPAALLPSDVDGEVAPEASIEVSESEYSSEIFSLSSDVYEWRKPGVDGCAHLQGCLALITNGRGGFLNLFLGTDESGRDAFIYTSSELVPQDNDTAGDIYDARIGGGTPPPPLSPVECEGDACSTPASPPNDATPSSFTFSGTGNVVSSSSTKPATKSKKPKPKKKTKHRKAKKKGKKAASRGPKRTVKSSRRSK